MVTSAKNPISTILSLLVALAISVILLGCDDKRGDEKGICSIAELNSAKFTIGVMTGAAATDEAKKALPLAQYKEYSMPIDAFTAICAGKIDAVVLDRPTLEFMALAHPELSVLGEDIAVGHISVAAAKSSGKLMADVNAFIRKYRENGTYQDMLNRWFHRKESLMPEIPIPENPDGALKVGVTANNEPLCFIQNGRLAGFDAEFALRLGAELNRQVEFIDLPYDAMVIALQSGKIDLAVAFMDAIPERMESVLFSDNYIDAPIAVLVQNNDALQLEKAKSNCFSDAWDTLASSFEKTFIRENRWQLILQGLATTIVITVFAVLLGTLCAFPLCMMCRSKRKILSWLGEKYISLIMGTPILVILMILYYVIFAKVDISGVLVAILAFAMDFAAYASVMLRSSIESIPRGQMEAALALGHKPSAAFMRFVLPQAIRSVLPVYRGEIISTLKSTSIVGYIAIMDLTKMGDIIRSRTYEAFFPLIAIAVIYFLTAKCLTYVLIVFEEKMNPEYRRDQLKRKGAK